MHQHAKFERNSFSRWRLTAILDLWGKFWDDPQREFGGLYHCTKFDWNRISRFLSVFRVKISENGNFLHCYPSRKAIARN